MQQAIRFNERQLSEDVNRWEKSEADKGQIYKYFSRQSVEYQINLFI